MNQVLYTGPHTINNRPILMKAWTPDFNLHDEVLRTIPLWVKFPNLPLICWSMKALSKIGSALGNPVYADDYTTGTVRISYARMLIEMDITKPLPRRVKMQDPIGKTIEHEISYDWESTHCNKCLQIGYNCNKNTMQQPHRQAYRGRRNKVKQVWQKTEKAGPKDNKYEKEQTQRMEITKPLENTTI
ncbi:uncharacterized protein [Nicotiana sylvestris]|uniref:uncharacterized protein n=1 Tax=Nicotiana sylvestris TaxID=4096 RepID=UPI00388C84FE